MSTTRGRNDDELLGEQAHLAFAEACLSTMRARAEATLAQAERDAHLDTAFDHAAISAVLRQRLVSLQHGRGALAFGRIDTDDGEVFRVGRRHVEDDDRNAVIVDWRATVSAPFYRATWVDSLGLARRRRFAIDGNSIAGFFDENFDDPDAAAEGGGVPDPLLAELDRARSGAMRDIVATIQAEQDEIIRAPLDDLIVVQGGPGTGKTAVGLHRAAFLLYEHRELFRRTPLLVIGPNPLFLAYIAEVLPSLGETSVTQTTMELLLRKHRLGHIDATAVARIKGDGRMAVVIDNVVRCRIGAVVEPLEVTTPFGVARLAEEEVCAQIDDVLGRRLPTNTARDVLREQLVASAWKSFSARTNADPAHHVGFVDGLRSSKGFKSALDRMWPSLSAAGVIRSLLTNRSMLAGAAVGILTAHEQALIHRSVPAAISAQRWSRAELALLDEAEEIISGVPRTFAHVVVDEAQDLSAMELRVAARRSPARSLTILGDLAQSTSAGGQHDWNAALDALRHASGRGPAGRVAELTLGYRVPARVLDVANRLLSIAAPGIRPARSVRESGDTPTFVLVGSMEAAIATAVSLAVLATRSSCALLANDTLLDDLATALGAAGAEFVDGRRAGATLLGGITLLDAVAAKGLEFDDVIVVEPNVILRGNDEAGRGARVLYVAMTRAVQSLTVVSSEPTPMLNLSEAECARVDLP